MQFLLFLHVLGVAVAVGAGAAHIQLMRDAGKGGDDAREFILSGRSIRVKTELPGYALAFLTGAGLLALHPALLHGQGWLHAKLVLVLFLFGFLHLEGRKARAILRLYTEGQLRDGMKAARWYANRFTLIPALLVIGIVYLAVVRPF